MNRFAVVVVIVLAIFLTVATMFWWSAPSLGQNDQIVGGDWQVVTALRNGQRYEDAEVANWVWKFDGHGGFTWEGAPPEMRPDFGPALFACDWSTQPRQIDFKHLTGPHASRITRGIYAFAGPELLVNMPLTPDGERPGGFDAAWFTGNLTVSLRPVRR